MDKLLAFLAIVAVILAAIYGYVVNVIDLIHLAVSGAPVTALFLLRALGIFVPIVGSALGFF